MKIPQRLSWGGITSIRTTQAREGWGKSRSAAKDLLCALGRETPKQHAQLCDGFSRIDQLPTKECAEEL